MSTFRAVLLCVAGLILGCVEAGAQSAAYPDRPVKILVPYAPGGATDIVARIIGEQMRQTLGQPVVVENKPGANGIIAVEEMARAKPDGHTLMVGNVTTNAIAPVLYRKRYKINYETDVVPVQRLVDIPAFLLVTTTNFQPTTVAELIDQAKKNPGKVRYGTVGAGSYPHYDMAFFAKRAGDLSMIAIHNKAGASGVINDMVTGDTQAAFLNVASTAAMVRAGKLKPLALVNHERLPEHPDVPTMKEVGYADVGTLALAGAVRAGGYAEGGAGEARERRRPGDADACRQGDIQEAELQHRAQQVARRRKGLARRRDGDLEEDRR